MPLAKNTRTDKIVQVPAHYIGHPVLGKELVLVEDEYEAPVASKKEKKKKPTGYNPVARDGDLDGFVQDATEWERPVGDTHKEQPAPELNNEENEDPEDAN